VHICPDGLARKLRVGSISGNESVGVATVNKASESLQNLGSRISKARLNDCPSHLSQSAGFDELESSFVASQDFEGFLDIAERGRQNGPIAADFSAECRTFALKRLGVQQRRRTFYVPSGNRQPDALEDKVGENKVRSRRCTPLQFVYGALSLAKLAHANVCLFVLRGKEVSVGEAVQEVSADEWVGGLRYEFLGKLQLDDGIAHASRLAQDDCLGYPESRSMVGACFLECVQALKD